MVEAKRYPMNPTIPPIIGRPKKANVASADRDKLEGLNVVRRPAHCSASFLVFFSKLRPSQHSRSTEEASERFHCLV